jgi:hypothetical protein
MKRPISHRKSRSGRFARVVFALIVAGLLLSAAAQAAISPTASTLTLAPGASGTENKTVDVPEVPSRADIQIAIDTTGSMGGAIGQAKASATQIVNDVKAAAPDAQFSIVEFKDAGDSPEYRVAQGFTSDATAVSAAVDTLFASGGGDFPEAFNLTFHNSYAFDLSPDPGWRTGSRKFVIVIGDAPPHGAATNGFPSCGDTSSDPHGLNTSTELAGMASAQRTLLMISAGNSILTCYQSLAAAAYTGGDAVDLGSDLSAKILELITGATAQVNDVHLEVTSASPSPASASWLSVTPASAGPVTTPASLPFTVTATVPAGTPSGTYTFDVVALADGADIGHQTLTIVVPSAPTLKCDGVRVDSTVLWPPNHKYRLVKLTGGDGLTSRKVTGVTQDEPLNGTGDGDTAPDAKAGPSADQVYLRAERSGTGDGRVYRISFEGSDGSGGTCTGSVTVGVPHDQGKGSTPKDSGASHNSFGG